MGLIGGGIMPFQLGAGIATGMVELSTLGSLTLDSGTHSLVSLRRGVLAKAADATLVSDGVGELQVGAVPLKSLAATPALLDSDATVGELSIGRALAGIGTLNSGESLGVLNPTRNLSVVDATLVSSGVADVDHVDLNTGLVAHWKFDNNGVDAAGDHHMTLTSGYTFNATSPPVGTHFIAASGAMVVESQSTFMDELSGNGQAITYGVWFKYTGANRYNYIFTVQGNSTIPALGVYYDATLDEVYATSGGQYTYHVKYTGLDANLGIDATDWFHIAVKTKPNTKSELYLNGSYAAIADTLLPSTTWSDWSNVLTLGKHWSAGLAAHGGIDDLRIYNATLTDDQIEALAAL